MTGPKSKKASIKREDVTRIEEALGYVVQAGDNKSHLSAMARELAKMGVSAPTKSSPAPSTSSVSIPRVTTTEISVITMLANPNEWFLLEKNNKKRYQNNLHRYGTCFESATRYEKGMYCHYARYNGGALSEEGRNRVQVIETKLSQIRNAVESGGIVTTAGSVTNSGSLAHASKYPLNDEERTFLDLVLNKPGQKVIISASSAKSDSWYGFRWKWTTRYGFDLSQFIISQKKNPDGTFCIYGIYQPNASGSMNPGLKSFVDFLQAKPVSNDESSSRQTRTFLSSIINK